MEKNVVTLDISMFSVTSYGTGRSVLNPRSAAWLQEFYMECVKDQFKRSVEFITKIANYQLKPMEKLAES